MSDPREAATAAWERLNRAFGGGVINPDDVRLPALPSDGSKAPGVAGGALPRAIIAVASGRAGDALGDLVGAANDRDHATAARARAWARLARHLVAEAVPGGAVTSATELLVHRHALPEVPAGGIVPDEVALECAVVGELLPRIRLARTFLGPRVADSDGDLPLVEETLGFVADIERDGDVAGDDALVAFCRRVRADLLHRQGRSADAAGVLERARAAAEAARDLVGLGACWLLRGDLDATPFGHPDAAGVVLLDSGTETSELPPPLDAPVADPSDEARADAVAAYDEAHRAFEAAGHDRGLAVVALRRAVMACATGDHTTAIALAEQARSGAATAGDLRLEATAAVHELLAEVADGRPTYASPTPRHVGSWGAGRGSFSHAFGLGLWMNRAGRRWLVVGGDGERAASCHRLARQLFEALGAPTQADQSLADVAVVHDAVGATLEATTELEQALEGHRARIEDEARGPDAWRRAVGIGLRLHRLALTRNDAAAIRRSGVRLAQLDAGAPHAEDGLDAELGAYCAETASSAEANALLAEGDQAREEGDEVSSHARYEAAVAATDDQLVRAAGLARLRRHGEALEAFRAHEDAGERRQQELLDQLRDVVGEEALAALRAPVAGRRLLREATFLARSRAFEAAAAAYDELERHAPGWWVEDTQPWELLSEHARVRSELGDHARATELHLQAIELLEAETDAVQRDELRTTLNSGSGRIYGRAAATQLAAANDGAEVAEPSLHLADRGRGRALAELLSRTRGGATSGDETLRAFTAVSAQVTLWYQVLASAMATSTTSDGTVDQLRERLSATQAQLDTLRSQLADHRPRFAAAIAPPTAATGQAERPALASGTVLVSHLLVDDRLLIHGVTGDGSTRATVLDVDAVRLRGMLRAFSTGCATGGPWIDVARELADLLLAPVGELLDTADRLYLVPTGIGHFAPLHVLPWRDELLGQRATVATLPSVASLVHLAPPTLDGESSALVVGDPEAMVLTGPSGDLHERLPALPYAGVEATGVARWFAQPELLLGADATGERVRGALARADLVHLATHAYVDRTVPLASALLLARGEALRIVDLAGMRFDAQLAVLSACDTGVGPLTAGDEVLNMTRALLAAGAASAIVSLWPVDDASTCLLMTRLASGLADGRDPSRALQEAQAWLRGLSPESRSAELRDLRERAGAGDPSTGTPLRSVIRQDRPPEVASAHPFHWGAFTYVGAHPGEAAGITDGRRPSG